MLSLEEGNNRKLKKRKTANEELHYLYSLPNIIHVVTSRKMRWVGHVACTGRTAQGVL
jgi:hypothetical protein